MTISCEFLPRREEQKAAKSKVQLSLDVASALELGGNLSVLVEHACNQFARSTLKTHSGRAKSVLGGRESGWFFSTYVQMDPST